MKHCKMASVVANNCPIGKQVDKTACSQVEKRYSEFAKLEAELKESGARND